MLPTFTTRLYPKVYRWINCYGLILMKFKIVPLLIYNNHILEVNIEYFEHLHDVYNDLPFCQENFVRPNVKHSKPSNST